MTEPEGGAAEVSGEGYVVIPLHQLAALIAATPNGGSITCTIRLTYGIRRAKNPEGSDSVPASPRSTGRGDNCVPKRRATMTKRERITREVTRELARRMRAQSGAPEPDGPDGQPTNPKVQ